MLICASCGSEEPEGSAFCGNCGTPLARADPPPDDAVSTPASTATDVVTRAPAAAGRATGETARTCGNCGSEEPEGSEFCGNCGTPLSPVDPQAGQATSIDGSTPTEVMASEDTDAPTAVELPTAAPQAPPSDPPLLTPAAAPPAARRRVPGRPSMLIAGIVVLVASGAAAVLLGTGVIGGNSTKSDSAFVRQVNEQVLGPLGEANASAAEHAGTADGALARSADGDRIVQVASEAAAQLRALSGLSEQQQREVQLLLALVAANQRYGEAFAAFEPADSQSELTLADAAAVARAALVSVQSQLPTELRFPSQTGFITLRAPSSPASTPTTTTTTTTTTTETPPASAVAYVQRVDELLRESHTVVLGLRSFIPRAASDAINRGDAVATARSYLGRRRLELERAQALTAPPAFAPAQGLLIRSLQASVADDEAVLAWTVARHNGSGNAQAALDEVNRIGAQATALKRQFLREYASKRQAATGRTPASLPDTF